MPKPSARSSGCPAPLPSTIDANATPSGSARSFRAPTPRTAIPARWSRRGAIAVAAGSELIRGAGQLGDPVAHLARFGDRERGNLVGAGRGVEHDGGQPEP